MPPSIRTKLWDKKVAELRVLVQTSTQPFPRDVKAQAVRKKRAATDLEFFANTYFPHYCDRPSSRLHKYLAKKFQDLIFKAMNEGLTGKSSDAAPRGNAKSTWGNLFLPLWCIAYAYRHFILQVSDTAAQAEAFIECIKIELECNERLQQDFPEICGQGSTWRARKIITANGIQVHAAGAGQSLRGFRRGKSRPDLVICDDLENDEDVLSEDSRQKLENWFFKALTKLGRPGCVYIVVGTLLDEQSLLQTLLDRPGWLGKKFQAVIHFSPAENLWQRWEEIYCDISIGKEEAVAAADSYFEQNQAAMLAGTEVLWPEEQPYYFLMKVRVEDGENAFQSEYMNNPVDPKNAIFLEEWIRYYDDDEVDLSSCKHGCAVDPSMGKQSKKADPSAIIGGRMQNGIIYLTVADIEKRHPDKITTDTLDHHQRDRFDEVDIEEVQFQELFKNQFETEAHNRGLTVLVKGVRPDKDKDLRIQSLQPWVKNGWIRFRRHGMGTLIKQFLNFRLRNKGGHDDGPDATEMLKKMLESGLVTVACAGAGDTPPRKEEGTGVLGLGRIGRLFKRREAA
ncbi:MAG TPA: phage terminase large subunit [Desulfuromonadaceae bacterium]